MATLDDLCEAVLNAREKRDSAKSVLDKADKAVTEAEAQLAKALEESGQDDASFNDRSFSRKTKVAWKSISSHKDDLLNLLRKEAPEVVKESVHTSTLNKFLNEKELEWQDDGPGWWGELRGFVERKESTVLSVTKIRKR